MPSAQQHLGSPSMTVVALAQGEVERTVAAMAAEIGADLTATLLGLDAAHVRHLMKARKGPAT